MEEEVIVDTAENRERSNPITLPPPLPIIYPVKSRHNFFQFSNSPHTINFLYKPSSIISSSCFPSTAI